MDDCFGGSFLACAKVDGPDCLDDVLAQNRNNVLPYYPPEDFSKLRWFCSRALVALGPAHLGQRLGLLGHLELGELVLGGFPSFFFF